MHPSYNHNISYAGHTFHVQTEISGTSQKSAVTHVFLSGDIIATSRTAVAPEQGDAELTAIMQKQHQDAMRVLIAGTHDSLLLARGVVLDPRPKS